MLRCDRRTVIEALAIATLGLALGLTVNHRLVFSALDRAQTPPALASVAAPYPTPVGLDEVRQLLAAGALAVDARATERYQEGHLPGARSLPFDHAVAPSTLNGRFPADKPLIVYCNGYGCTDSFELAVQLLAAGYAEVRVFEGGWPAWHDAGLPVEGGR